MILRITIIGLLAGVIGTGLGGIISALFKRNVDRYLDFFMGLSGGIMLAVVVFDLISILLHNLPEGLAIGSSFMSTETLGMTLAIVIGIHNVPEGLAMALSLVGSRMKISKVILFTIIAGIPMGIGSFIGAYFGGVFHSLIGVFLALAAGTMMYVVLEEIFPKSRSLYCIIGFLIGTIIVYYI